MVLRHQKYETQPIIRGRAITVASCEGGLEVSVLYYELTGLCSIALKPVMNSYI